MTDNTAATTHISFGSGGRTPEVKAEEAMRARFGEPKVETGDCRCDRDPCGHRFPNWDRMTWKLPAETKILRGPEGETLIFLEGEEGGVGIVVYRACSNCPTGSATFVDDVLSAYGALWDFDFGESDPAWGDLMECSG